MRTIMSSYHLISSQVSAERPDDPAILPSFVVNENHVLSRKKIKGRKGKEKLLLNLRPLASGLTNMFGSCCEFFAL